jgi:uncharacterized membrane protein YkvA (DUF1232 family)
LLAGYAGFVACLIRTGRREDARAVAGFIPTVWSSSAVFSVTTACRGRPRPLLVALVGYLVMPFDLVPDFIPVAGQLDDAIVVALVLRPLLRASGREVLREHWRGPTTSLSVLLRAAGEIAPAG